MNDVVSRSAVERFYQAYDSRDPARIGDCLDDEVVWEVMGPVTVMQICGQWRGKAAVIDRFAHVVSKLVEFKKFERTYLLVDGDQSAACGTITSRHCASGRTISHRVAHFVQYRNGKVISFRAAADTLDAVEQFIGHRFDFGASSADSDLVTL